MDFILSNWVLILIAAVSGYLLFVPLLTRGGLGTGIGTVEAVQLINHERAVIIDVCEPNEFAAGHITDARNIPLGQLENELPKAVKNKNLPVIMSCATGMRAGRAVVAAKKLGYDRAVVLGGGNRAWQDANLPFVRGGKTEK